MEIVCPNCGEPIPAASINVQKMVAVCPACNHVFAFELPAGKKKRRKFKQPENLMIHEADTLHMVFRPGSREGQKRTVGSMLFPATVFTVVMAGVLRENQTSADVPVFVLALLGLMTLFLYYMVALTLINKTHIEVDDESITVSRRPLPGPINYSQDVPLAGVESIKCVEMPVSRQTGYNTQLYSVRAVMADDYETVIINSVTQEYGFYIAQHLSEFLDLDATHDTITLADATATEDDPAWFDDDDRATLNGMHANL